MSTAEERFQAMMAKRKKAKESVEKEEKPIVVNEKNSKKILKRFCNRRFCVWKFN